MKSLAMNDLLVLIQNWTEFKSFSKTTVNKFLRELIRLSFLWFRNR